MLERPQSELQSETEDEEGLHQFALRVAASCTEEQAVIIDWLNYMLGKRYLDWQTIFTGPSRYDGQFWAYGIVTIPAGEEQGVSFSLVEPTQHEEDFESQAGHAGSYLLELETSNSSTSQVEAELTVENSATLDEFEVSELAASESESQELFAPQSLTASYLTRFQQVEARALSALEQGQALEVARLLGQLEILEEWCSQELIFEDEQGVLADRLNTLREWLENFSDSE